MRVTKSVLAVVILVLALLGGLSSPAQAGPATGDDFIWCGLDPFDGASSC
ncbi:hypothetical protein AB0M47_03095 [Hamadaea sp. NPDC051192]